MPTSNEHVEVKTLYEKALDAKINPPPPKPEVEEEPSTSDEAVLEPKPEIGKSNFQLKISPLDGNHQKIR